MLIFFLSISLLGFCIQMYVSNFEVFGWNIQLSRNHLCIPIWRVDCLEDVLIFSISKCGLFLPIFSREKVPQFYNKKPTIEVF